MSRRRSCTPSVFLFLTIILAGVFIAGFLIPLLATKSFGPPSGRLNIFQRANYGFQLLIHSNELLLPVNSGGEQQLFTISPDESVLSISTRLENSGLIWSAKLFRTYLIWTGSDTYIQAGTYRIKPAQNSVEIAGMLKSSNLTEVTLVILPGWRSEEIAAAMAASGLEINPDEFIARADFLPNPPEFIPVGKSLEGFLAPGQYILSRTTTTDQLLSILTQEFSSELTPELRNGFSLHGLTVFEAVTLASIIQREAMFDDEMPLLASVFYNRLAIGMALQSDPTIQYALGYNTSQTSWWTTPLSASDMQINSPYNTYLYAGLPPGPISSPSQAALAAVAFPATTGYYFFQARCDGSGLHNFAVTYEEHLSNNCP
jgi:UPF0755 protein